MATTNIGSSAPAAFTVTENLPDAEFSDSLDIRAFIYQPESFKHLDAKDPCLWKNIASRVGLNVSDDAAPNGIKQQLMIIHDIAETKQLIATMTKTKQLKTNNIVPNTIITIETLRKANKCRDFLVVWREVISTLNLVSGQSFKIPLIATEEQDPEALDKMFGNWIKGREICMARSSFNTLNLGKLKLHFLSNSIGNLASLKTLYLEHNHLTTLPNSIGNLSNLKELHLENNNLTALPDSFGNLISLEMLYLEHNQLRDLPTSIGELTKLQWLHLHCNQLRALPDSFEKLILLEVLYLDHNQLTTLPNFFEKLVGKLIVLDLKENLLKYIPEKILEKFPYLGSKGSKGKEK